MQLHAGRPADQWSGFAALDAGNSGEPAARYDSARHHAAWRYQHRSGNGGYANAEHVGMRREHDDESGDARHDGTGQRHWRRGNAGRIASGLLTGSVLDPRTIASALIDVQKGILARHRPLMARRKFRPSIRPKAVKDEVSR
jgi:hypothetical protein